MGTKKKRIQVYVNDATYGQIEGYAQERGVSISEAAGQLLSTQVIGAASVSKGSDYVTKAQLERALVIMETRYQAISETLLSNQRDLYESSVHFSIGQLAEVSRELEATQAKVSENLRSDLMGLKKE